MLQPVNQMSRSCPDFSRAYGAIEVHTETHADTHSLLDVPRPILENIYNLLEISDRVRLNVALPIASRVIIDTKKDKKLALIYRLFKKIGLEGPLSDKKFNEFTSSVTTFLSDNSSDPTVVGILSEMPLLAADIKVRSTMCPLAALIMSQPVGQTTIVWDESTAYYNRREVMDTMWRYGTPAIFDALMASKNPFSDAILKDTLCCMRTIVDLENTGRLLAHYMTLATNRTHPFTCPVKADKILHYFNDSDRLITMRWNSALQIRLIVEEVGVCQTVLDALIEHYAKHLETETVSYLESAGARF